MAENTPYAQQVGALRKLAAAEDVDGLATELIGIAEINGGQWGRDGRDAAGIIEGLPTQVRGAVLLEVVRRTNAAGDDPPRVLASGLMALVTKHFSTDLAPQTAEVLLGWAARQVSFWPGEQLAMYASVLIAAGLPIPAEGIAVMRRTVHTGYDGKGSLKVITDSLSGPLLNCGEAWADQALADLDMLGDSWRALVAHALTATAPKPSAKWERQAGELLETAAAHLGGTDDVGKQLRGWLALVGRPRTLPLVRREYDPDVNEAFDPYNATALRGLVWLMFLLPEHPETARTLGALVETSLRKVAGIGPRNPKVANAGVYALSRIPSEAALGQIARLAARVTFKGTLKELNAALDARATALNLTRDEVEELAVPTYGLTEVGRRVEILGDVTAELTVTGKGTSIGWRTAAGRAVKAPPAAVKSGHADELKELKASAKDIDKMLGAQAERLDRQFLAQRVWPHATWRERYLDHPLVGTLARRLIWIVDDRPGCYFDGALRDIEGRPIVAEEDAQVRLWHPIGRDVDEVLAWRAFLERNEITQPFKQAHREVYLLTAAEERTRTYSNRYAAHILRQHQFHALTAARGWTNRLRLMVDDTYPPASRLLPQWGLRAEFWIEGIGEDYGADTTESGAFLRLVTDQVRFYPTAAPENHAHAGGGGYEQWVRGGAHPTGPLPLADIPPLVLSEVLRDVDLFVGVSSVGNDPTWQDGGPEGRFRDYWQSYSFGELSGTAQTRKDLLARLIPRLAIADRAHLDGRFLVVRGDLRSYKIHLGSGNILMTPNDQYLCIVPKNSPASTRDVFLPFEGDRVLAVILSKAMLLAKDTEITDATITHQIRR